jgi:hypothetical protein
MVALERFTARAISRSLREEAGGRDMWSEAAPESYDVHEQQNDYVIGEEFIGKICKQSAMKTEK